MEITNRTRSLRHRELGLHILGYWSKNFISQWTAQLRLSDARGATYASQRFWWTVDWILPLKINWKQMTQGKPRSHDGRFLYSFVQALCLHSYWSPFCPIRTKNFDLGGMVIYLSLLAQLISSVLFQELREINHRIGAFSRAQFSEAHG